jgi:hypothetical protein
MLELPKVPLIAPASKVYPQRYRDQQYRLRGFMLSAFSMLELQGVMVFMFVWFEIPISSEDF